MKKRKPGSIGLRLCLVIGILLLLYPNLSNRWNSYHISQAITNYNTAVSGLSEEVKTEALRSAEYYNENISSRTDAYSPSENELTEYPNLLNVNEDGIMGDIVIPKIGVDLPIYHGTEEKVLRLGAGHVSWSALPVGGDGTCCVISGHTGLPASKLFTDLDELEVGDSFYLNVLGEKLVYEIFDCMTVLPEEVEYLLPKEGEDRCILITCTPYGINSHRLLVIGKRISENDITPEMVPETTKTERKPIFLIAGITGFLLLLLLILFRSKKARKKKCE